MNEFLGFCFAAEYFRQRRAVCSAARFPKSQESGSSWLAGWSTTLDGYIIARKVRLEQKQSLQDHLQASFPSLLRPVCILINGRAAQFLTDVKVNEVALLVEYLLLYRLFPTTIQDVE